MEVDGEKEREMEAISSQNDKDSELACDRGETADGSGVSVPLLHEDGPEEESEMEGTGINSTNLSPHCDTNGTGAILITPSYSGGTTDVPVAPEASLHLTIPVSASEREEPNGGEEEEHEELVVLDPEHPLMRRFQSALKNHLKKQLDRLNMEIREQLAMEHAECTRREELGVELYSVQLQLAQLQAALEGRHEANAQAAKQRLRAQEQLEGVRSQYHAAVNKTGQQRVQVSQLQTEVENLALRLFYMQEVSEGVRSDLTTMKNASRKAQSEKLQAEEEKQKQDLYVERLTKQVEKLTEQIALYEFQISTQSKETQAAKQVLVEAQMEIDSLEVERKQLLQQWNSSLLGMQRRDEAFAAKQGELRMTRHHMQSLDTEIEGFKKSITQEEERNELLTALLSRTQMGQTTTRRLIGNSQAQQEALQAQYSTYARTLQETEQTLSRHAAECAARQTDAASLRKEVEKESAIRQELEEKIMAKMQEQQLHGNAAKFSHGLIEKMAAHRREKEAQLAQLENEAAQAGLEGGETALRLESLGRHLGELRQENARRHELLSRGEAEFHRCAAVIARKQSAINVYNKKIEQMVFSTGHADLGPLEIRVSTLTKQLEEAAAEIVEQQQFWLRHQGELVRLTQEKQAQSAALLAQQTRLTILQQRKVRTEGEIQQEQREQAELERHIKGLLADTVKLNTLLSRNSQLRQALEQGNALMESGFLQKLKEAERESVRMQMKLEEVQENKERLISRLVEAERHVMLWEKKIQLAKETRLAVDSEVGQGEIRQMKAEIHRMEVRCAHLMKQQERLLRDMEAAVAQREAVAGRAAARAKARAGQPTQTEFQGFLQGLRRKIQDTQKVWEAAVILCRPQTGHLASSQWADRAMGQHSSLLVTISHPGKIYCGGAPNRQILL
uniref:Coiled-coil domain 40 molecular ruler complex subunit n=1 Tax=Paramormyrops kingsleyae TaxID=1676925 RepID=A0A3B3RJE8_9TELE